MVHDTKMTLYFGGPGPVESLLEYRDLWLPANRNNGTALLDLLSYIRLHLASMFFCFVLSFLMLLLTESQLLHYKVALRELNDKKPEVDIQSQKEYCIQQQGKNSEAFILTAKKEKGLPASSASMDCRFSSN